MYNFVFIARFMNMDWKTLFDGVLALLCAVRKAFRFWNMQSKNQINI